MLGNPCEFMERIINFKVENVSEEVMKEVMRYIGEHPEFTIENMGKISKAGQSLCIWVHNICQYYKIVKQIKK